jgi:hypothetical protein
MGVGGIASGRCERSTRTMKVTVIARRPQADEAISFNYNESASPKPSLSLRLGTGSSGAPSALRTPRNPHEPRRTPDHESTWEGRRPRRPGLRARRDRRAGEGARLPDDRRALPVSWERLSER